jgi:thiol-disulfide isomerase/thioredoxin
MRKLFMGLFLLTAIILTGVRTAEADPPLNGEMSKFNLSAGHEELSRVSLSDAQDNDVSLAQFKGKIVLLNVWATWCGPCVMEMPKLDHLQATMGSNDFVVVPVSIDRGGAHQAMPFLNRMNVASLTPYFDRSNSIGRLLSASRVPVTLVIGRDGNEIGRFVGTADWDSDEARNLIKYFISDGKSGVQTVKSDQVSMNQ